MKNELGWRVEGTRETQPYIIIDVTKGGIPQPPNRFPLEDKIAVFNDGPVTGELAEAIGKAPKGTRLEGHLWTTGDRIYGRYRRAQLPGGRTVPICVELIDDVGDLGIPGEEGSKPGHVVHLKNTGGLGVERWH